MNATWRNDKKWADWLIPTGSDGGKWTTLSKLAPIPEWLLLCRTGSDHSSKLFFTHIRGNRQDISQPSWQKWTVATLRKWSVFYIGSQQQTTDNHQFAVAANRWDLIREKTTKELVCSRSCNHQTAWLKIDNETQMTERKWYQSLTVPLHISPRDQFVCPANQHPKKKNNQEKKPTNLCAPHEFLKKMSAMFDNHTILLFWL